MRPVHAAFAALLVLAALLLEAVSPEPHGLGIMLEVDGKAYTMDEFMEHHESGNVGTRESQVAGPDLIMISPETDPFAAPLPSGISVSPGSELPDGAAPAPAPAAGRGPPSPEGIGTGCDGDEAVPGDGAADGSSGCGGRIQMRPLWPGEPAYATDVMEDLPPEDEMMEDVMIEDEMVEDVMEDVMEDVPLEGALDREDVTTFIEDEVPAAAEDDGAMKLEEEDRTARELEYKVANVDDPSDPFSLALLSVPPGSSPLTIRCNPVNEFACTMQSNGGVGRYITATSGQVYIENITFTGWTASGGGAVLLRDNSIGIFTNVTFVGNHAQGGYMGGAVAVINSTAEFRGCRFVSNTALPEAYHALRDPAAGPDTGSAAGATAVYNATFDSRMEVSEDSDLASWAETIHQRSITAEIIAHGGGVGGGVAVVGGRSDVRVLESQFDGNEANGGGAVFHYRGKVAIEGTEFTRNTAKVEGGAVYAEEADWLLLSESSVSKARAAQGCGGALAFYGGTYTIVNSSVAETGAGLCGGAMLSSSGATATVFGSAFSGCTAPVGGCFYALKNSTLLLQNSFISGAAAEAFGGAAVVDGEATTLRLTATILDGATAGLGGGLVAASSRSAIVGLNATFSRGRVIEGSSSQEVSGGGAILLIDGSRMWCTGCNLTGNAAPRSGPGNDFSLLGASFLALRRCAVRRLLDEAAPQGSGNPSSLSSIHLDDGSFATLGPASMTFLSSPVADAASRRSFVTVTGGSSLAARDVTFRVAVLGSSPRGPPVAYPAAVLLFNGSQAAVDGCIGLPREPPLDVHTEDPQSKVFLRPVNGSGLVYSGAAAPESCWSFDCARDQEVPPLCPSLRVLKALAEDALDLDAEFLSVADCKNFPSTTAWQVSTGSLPPQEQCPADQSMACSASSLVDEVECPAVCDPVPKAVAWYKYVLYSVGAVAGVAILMWIAYVTYSSRGLCCISREAQGVNKVELTKLSVSRYMSTDSDGCDTRTPSSSKETNKQAPVDVAMVARVDTTSQHIDMDVDFESEIRPFLSKSNFIGAGGFGEVYQITYRGRRAAVKVFPGSFCGPSDEQYASYLQELELMGRFQRFPEIVSTWGASVKRPNMALVYELVEGGSLADRVHKGLPMTYAEIVKAGHDIAVGLSHLHPTVVHRDLKPANILIGTDGTCKLIDFGLSRGKDPYVSYIDTEAGGTPNYMPPEMFDGSKIDEKVDIYALGMILFECIMREVPWQDCDCLARVVFQVSIQRERPKLPASTPWPLARLIRKCWADEPFKRPSAYEVAKALEFMMEDRIGEAGTPRLLEETESSAGSDESTPNGSAQAKRTQLILAAAAAAGPEAEAAIRSTIRQAQMESVAKSPFLNESMQATEAGPPGDPGAAFLPSHPSDERPPALRDDANGNAAASTSTVAPGMVGPSLSAQQSDKFVLGNSFHGRSVGSEL